MAVIVQILNGTNYCRDTGFQAGISAILQEGVRKGYSGELAITTSQVAAGMCFIRVTRDVVTPNEIFLVPVIVTVNTPITTSGNGYVIAKISKAKVNDGSTNSGDGSNIASIATVSTLVGITDPYIVLATLASGVITDARTWAQIDEKILDDEFYYDQDAQANDSYQITIQGVKKYIDGKEYSFKAATTNTGAATLAVSGLAAKSIRKNYNSVLSDGDIVAGQIIVVRYDSANDFFQMLTPPGSNPGIPSKATIPQAQAGTDDATYLTPLKGVYTAISWGNVELGTYGDAIIAGDLTANTNLMYQLPTDKKWYKVTSVTQTWYYKLALALEIGSIGATGKRLLRKGAYTLGTSLGAAVNPTFSNTGTGSDNSIGDNDTNIAGAYPLNTTQNAEAIISTITIKGKQIGAPSGPLNLYIVARGQSAFENNGNPACVWDSTNNVIRGAIIGQASIPQASFSGVYQNLVATISGGPIRLPAGVNLYLVASKGGFSNGSNYYLLDNNGFTYKRLTAVSNTWSGSDSNTGNWSLGVTSNPSVGYAVKAFDVGGAIGSYSLTPFNCWSKVIGELVDNGATLFFDPDRNDTQNQYANYQNVPTAVSGLIKIPLNFCPSSLKVVASNKRQATTPVVNSYHGSLRPDRSSPFGGEHILPLANGQAGSFTDDFLSPFNFANSGLSPCGIGLNNGANFLHALRMEQGVILYNSYANGANFMSAGAAGFTGFFSIFDVQASYK